MSGDIIQSLRDKLAENYEAYTKQLQSCWLHKSRPGNLSASRFRNIAVSTMPHGCFGLRIR